MTTHGFPETNVFFRKLTLRLPVITHGKGCWLYDAEGNAFLDGSGGAFVVNVGHGVREIADAMAEQGRKLGYVSGMAFSNEPVEELAAELVALAPGDLDKVYPLSSGSDAIEAALKLARQYWLESGKTKKHKIIALAPAYHGNTLLALSASAREHYRRIYGEWLVDVVRVPAPYAYRCGCGGRPPYCSACSGAALEEAIIREGPETVAAFIAEPVGGSSTGASVPPPEYFPRVREICDRHGVLFVADEVLAGAGRTGTWSALEPTGVVPDVQVLGKGIAGGYAPLAAVLAPTRIAEVFAHGSGALNHAQTFSHHPVLCAAGVATLRYLREHRLVERCAAIGSILQQRLATLRDLACVGDVRGRGLLAGVEIVENRDTRAPFARDVHAAERITAAALAAGLVVWPNVGHVDGGRGDIVMIAPPFIVTEQEIDAIVERLRVAIDTAGLAKQQSAAVGAAAR